MKANYIAYVLHDYLQDGNFDAEFGGRWITEEDFMEIVTQISGKAFAPYGIDARGRYKEESASLILEIQKGSGLLRRGDEYVGQWYKLDVKKKDEVISSLQTANPAKSLLDAIGEEALARALRRVADEDGLPEFSDDDSILSIDDRTYEPLEIEIPASDRVVRLNDNQVSELDKPLEQIINLVEKENSIAGEEGLRELTLGRLKAGRELLRAAIFSVQSFQLTLIVGLQMLVEKYKKHAIGAAAGNLLTLLIEAIRNA